MFCSNQLKDDVLTEPTNCTQTPANENISEEEKKNPYVINVDRKVEAIKQANELEPFTVPDLSERAQMALKEAGWENLMPVQAKAMPYFAEGKDIMVQSRTGSGKTGAFILPILDKLEHGKGTGQALILVPTRELATQVANEAETLGKPFGIRSVAVYGGVGYLPQQQAFADGVEIIVATPGRLLDHLLKEYLRLDHIRFLIFDEADRMLSMGFLPDMKAVRYHLPKKQRVFTYMFSATFPPEILSLAYQFMAEPSLLSLSRDHVHVTDNAHILYIVPHMKKGSTLATVIDLENPSSAIVFCNRKDDVNYVAVLLKKYGFNVDQISSDLNQKAREKVMEKLRKGEIALLVATDVAARGIDIPEISHVFQYGPPEDPESYIHRSGRTGRAGAQGTAITILSDVEKLSMNKVVKKYEIEFEERQLPSVSSLSAIMGERVVASLESQFRKLTRHEKINVGRLSPYVRELSQSEEGIELLGMVLNEMYQKAFRGGHPKDAISTPSPLRHSSGRGGRGRGDSRGRGHGGRGEFRGHRDSRRHNDSRGGRGSRKRHTSSRRESRPEGRNES